MFMFEFQFDPLDQTRPWGGQSIHWWALTAGVFFVQLGESRLFHCPGDFHDDALERNWLVGPWRGAFDDHVAALCRPLGECLAAWLEPVPADVAAQACLFFDTIADDDDETWELERAASSWLYERGLRPGACRATLYAWRVADRMHFRWDNADVVGEDGQCVWSSPKGTATLALDDFLDEADRFVRSFDHQMQRRIEAAAAFAWDSHIRIDISQIRTQHLQEMQLLQRGFDLRNRRHTDWLAVCDSQHRLITRRQKP